jgi:nucleotide-binding universal stress UspA family protein
MGSAPYISPEQVLGVRDDPRSDLFALGAILYELATGRTPFGVALRRRLYRDPVPPRAIRPEIPDWLQEVVLRCLEVSPQDRHASAEDLARDLLSPEAVALGARASRLRRDPAATVLRRFLRAAGHDPASLPRGAGWRPEGAVILVALATAGGEERHDALRAAARWIAASDPRARITCATVVKPASELGGSSGDETAADRHIRHLGALRRWAEPLDLPAARLSFHVLEARDPADALVGYARANRVDLLLVGAPPHDPLVSLLGTVATKVAANAPCSVVLVRPQAAP